MLYSCYIILFHRFTDRGSILGMNLFGCKFCRKTSDQSTTCDRKNFDSLLWAIVTVFQVYAVDTTAHTTQTTITQPTHTHILLLLLFCRPLTP